MLPQTSRLELRSLILIPKSNFCLTRDDKWYANEIMNKFVNGYFFIE